MGINPLNLPPGVTSPQLDWSPIDKIGDAIFAQRQRQALADTAARFTRDGQIDYAGLAGAYAGAGDLDRAAKVATVGKTINADDTTDEIKEYRLAQRQGERRNFSDWKSALKRAGATQVNVNQQGEKAYEVEVNKDYAKNFIKIQEHGRDAAGAVGTLNLMERLTHDPNFYSGTAGQWATVGKRAAATLGISDKEAATPNELFSTMSNRLVLDASGGSLGTGFSNADRDFIQATVPTLQNTPDGNRAIIDMQRKVYLRKQQVAHLAREYTRRNGRIDDGFDDVLSRWAEANPVFPRLAQPPARQPQGAPQGQPQPPQATPPVQGARQAPDGNWYVPDPNRPGKYLQVK